MNIRLSGAALLCALFFSCSSVRAQNAVADPQIKTIVIPVVNLHCNGDMPTIKARLLNQEGIMGVEFTDRKRDLSTFTVQYHSAATTAEAVEKAIESTPGCDAPEEMPYRVKKSKKKAS